MMRCSQSRSQSADALQRLPAIPELELLATRSQSADALQRFPSIPELELPATVEDDDISSQSQVHTDICHKKRDLLSWWCHGELRRALCTLMRSGYAPSFAIAPSSSSMSLQTIAQRLQEERYVNENGSTDADMFWSDVDRCLGRIERSLANQADVECLTMVAKLRALADQLELDFWGCLLTLEQCPSDEDALLSLVVVGSRAIEASTDMAEWLFGNRLFYAM